MGFHQVEVDLRDRAKTAFFTYRGLYVYNVEALSSSATPPLPFNDLWSGF